MAKRKRRAFTKEFKTQASRKSSLTPRRCRLAQAQRD